MILQWIRLLCIVFLATSLVAFGCVGSNDSENNQTEAGQALQGGKMKKGMIILYVADQQQSRSFYRKVLDIEPTLDVPGMTEFPISSEMTLGLMPEDGTSSFLGEVLPAAEKGNGIPRCELYLFVDDPQKSYELLSDAGGTPVSPPAKRPWGDMTAYGADPDGHVIAFAKTAP